MAFIQPCFIQKCTPALIEKLVGLGYKIAGKTTLSYGIFCNNGKIKICSTNEQPSIKDKDFIQCYNNEGLFLALAALRDDTDFNQWFVMDVEIYMDINQGDWFLATNRSKGKHIGTQIDPMYCHKATVEEIIEHFSNCLLYKEE